MARCAALAAVAALTALCAQPAAAQNSGGASFRYNDANGQVAFNAKNAPTSERTLTRVSFTLPGGTTIPADVTPTGGGDCTRDSAQEGSCDFDPGRLASEQAFILFGTDGPEPVEIAVTLGWDDASTQDLVATKCPPIDVTPDAVPFAVGGSPYSHQFGISGGPTPASFGLTGALPEGLTLSNSGLLSGRPRTVGTFQFTVTASDANGCTGNRTYLFEVKPEGTPPPVAPDVAITLLDINRVTTNGELSLGKTTIFDLLNDNVTVPGATHYYGVVKGRFAVTNTGTVPTDARVRGDLVQDQLALRVTQRDLRATERCEAIETATSQRSSQGDFICFNLAPGETREMPFGYSVTSAPGLPADPPHAGALELRAEVRPVDGTPDDNFIPRPGAPPVEVQVVNTFASEQDKIPKRVSATKLTAFTGTTDADGSGPNDTVKRVEIALVRLQDGAKTARPRCHWLRNARARFRSRRARGRRCGEAVWLRARGTRRWSFRLRKQLPKGSYALYSRVVGASGFGEQVFSRRAGNRQTFKVVGR